MLRHIMFIFYRTTRILCSKILNESENDGHCLKQSNSILNQLCITTALEIIDRLQAACDTKKKNMGSNYLKSCTFNI